MHAADRIASRRETVLRKSEAVLVFEKKKSGASRGITRIPDGVIMELKGLWAREGIG